MRRKILLKQFMDWVIASNSLLFMIQKFIQVVVSAQFLHKFCTAIACVGYILLVRCGEERQIFKSMNQEGNCG